MKIRQIPLSSDKGSSAKGWNTPLETSEYTTKKPDKSKKYGIFPGDFGCIMIDLDYGDGVKLVKRHRPIKVFPSLTKGHFHLWYKAGDYNLPKFNWEYGGSKGEVFQNTAFIAPHYYEKFWEWIGNLDLASHEALPLEFLEEINTKSFFSDSTGDYTPVVVDETFRKHTQRIKKGSLPRIYLSGNDTRHDAVYKRAAYYGEREDGRSYENFVRLLKDKESDRDKLKDSLREAERGWAAGETHTKSENESVLEEFSNVNQEAKRTEWLWRGVLGKGEITLLCGASDSGKGTFLKDLIVRACNRTDWYDKTDNLCDGNIWLDSENDQLETNLNPIFKHMGMDYSRFNFSKNLARMIQAPEGSKDYNTLELFAEKCPPSLVVVDRHFGGITGSTDDKVLEAYGKYDQFCKKYNCAILMVLHTNKASLDEFKSWFGAVKGFGTYTSFPRFAIHALERREEEERVTNFGMSKQHDIEANLPFGKGDESLRMVTHPTEITYDDGQKAYIKLPKIVVQKEGIDDLLEKMIKDKKENQKFDKLNLKSDRVIGAVKDYLSKKKIISLSELKEYITSREKIADREISPILNKDDSIMIKLVKELDEEHRDKFKDLHPNSCIVGMTQHFREMEDPWFDKMMDLIN